MPWIQTHSGIAFEIVHPSEQQVNIEDIAHSLSLQCRFGGHCKEFYSVAEHSLRVAEKLPRHLKIYGLLHDAAEAYIMDLPRPLKPLFEEYQSRESRIQTIIENAFDLKPLSIEQKKEIKDVDERMLATERRDLMNACKEEWGKLPDPYEDIVYPMSSQAAELIFLEAFKSFWKGRLKHG